MLVAAILTDRSTTPEETLARAAGGDHSAFADIVREHQAMVFSMAYHFLRDRWAAEELSQEVFLHLYRNLRAIETPQHLVLWLRKVTSHRCIDQSRRKRVRPAIGLHELPEPAAPLRAADPILSATLGRLVNRLPEKARMILLLRYQEDLEPGEIAEVLDIPLGTVKSSLHRALAVLRGKLSRGVRGASR